MVQARIVPYHGSPAVEVNGRVMPPMAFTAFNHTRDRDYLKALGDAGIRIFFLMCDPEWLRKGSVEELMEDTRTLLSVVPDALVFLRLGVHPSVEWINEHPDEVMCYQDGTKIPTIVGTESYRAEYPGMYALYSQAWREEASKHIIGFLDALAASPYADHYIGAFLAGGNTSEWYPSNKLTIRKGDPIGYYAQGNTPSERDLIGDFSPAFRQAFSGWLREKYGTVEKLRAEWNDPEATFENPHIPTMDERSFIYSEDDIERVLKLYKGQNLCLGGDLATGESDKNADKHVGAFLNADKYQCVADFYRAFHVGAADTIIHFGRAIKEKYPNLLVGAFYGYFGCLDYYNMCMCAGARKALDSGVVDITACPNIYLERQLGGYAAQRVMLDSFRIRNRMFFSEDDTRTHLDGAMYRDQMEVYTPRDSVNAMKRDFGRNVCQDMFGWWFDQVEEGRYKDETLYALMKRQQEISAAAYEMDRVKHNEVCVFYDEESVHYAAAKTLWQMNELYRTTELPRAGFPMDFRYHDDIAMDEMPDYKLYIFASCYCLTDQERLAISDKVKRAGKTALFLYGQGFINPDARPKVDVDHISELTGIRLTQYDRAELGKFRVDTKNPIMKDCDPGKVYGYFDQYLMDGCSSGLNAVINDAYPFFTSEDPDAITLGRICDTGLPALSLKQTDGFNSVYGASKWLSCDILRAVARLAGVHVFADQGDYVFANRSFITIHARTRGEKRLYLREACDPYEVYEKRFYGRGVREMTFPMYRGQTLMFHLRGAL